MFNNSSMTVFHLFKRHPIPMAAWFRHSLVLTYAFPPVTLEPLLPPGLVLDTFRGRAFLAIALVQTQNMRPTFLPAAVGGDFFLSGYRIFTRLAGGSHSKRGLRILRSDADSPWMVRGGNLLTHYHYRLCHTELDEHAGKLHWTVRTPNAEADLDVTAQIGGAPAPLPAGSPFRSLAEARRFAGPLPYTFDYEQPTGSIIGIRAVRQEWNPQPVTVEIRQNTFLEHEPFRSAAPVLANAFHVGGVPYRWERGRRML
ncbi:MAG TPA: DUF2071 domain-containing protein [Terracidiphilus sp.]